jgi:uncharacterized membrane protein YbhN (UPF0104 family)
VSATVTLPKRAARRRWLDLARVVFVGAVLAFAWWGMHDRTGELVDALTATSPWRIALSGVFVVIGIAVTSTAWLRLLAAYGRELPPGEGRAVFFVGQLGKYIPGAVWSMGAHAELARRHRVPVRTTVGTSLVFLGVNLATAALVAASAAILGASSVDVPGWVLVLVLLAAVAGLSPWAVNYCGSLLSAGDRLELTHGGLLRVVVLQGITWACYAGAMLLLAPEPSPRVFAVAAGAFATAYAVGVLVVLAPAGLGARDVTLVALLAPVMGLTSATAIALVTRVLHTGGDLGLALLAWAWARLRRKPAVVESSSVS